MVMLKKLAILVAVLCVVGFVVPERITIPVAEASRHDWNPNSFWFEPWGTSGVHKGIDIFAHLGRPVVSATDGIVLFAGHLAKGGNVVVALGPKWRIHYYAHLNTIETSIFRLVWPGQAIGTVGDSGNAKGKPPHLHYSIVRLVPVPWAADGSTQGYKKAFFIDPSAWLGR
ncbi:Predicted peptidase M23B [gamma proteobacterium HdN1]|nr:Predicted peptidase M23B [gamma proteobacterium HdN1]